MVRSGGLAVEVHSSHPVLGDPAEFVFFLQPPYSSSSLESKMKAMKKLWVDRKKQLGYTLRSPIAVRGPFPFLHHLRIDLRDEHIGDDEYQFRAWFRRDKPLTVPADIIDRQMQLRAQFGYPVNQPVSRRSAEPLRFSGRVMQTSSDPFKER